MGSAIDAWRPLEARIVAIAGCVTNHAGATQPLGEARNTIHFVAVTVTTLAVSSRVGPPGGFMTRKIAYWASTTVVAVALLGALTYLTGSEQVVTGFTRSGYPQHLRIVLGIAKPAAAIVLVLPGLPLLKEWAYAGVTFAWIMAAIAAYSVGDGVGAWAMPLVLLALLVVSYVTRPANRRLMPLPAAA